MIYLLDTSTWSELFHFYQDVFVTLWGNLDKMIEDKLIFSVDACYEELLKQRNFRDLKAREWLDKNKAIFLPLEAEDAVFMWELFRIENGRS